MYHLHRRLKMKKVPLIIILLLFIFTSELYSASPFIKKKNWFGFGFIFTNPQREVRFGKYHEYGFDGKIFYRYVLRQNLEFGVTGEYGLYSFSPKRFIKDKSIAHPMEHNTENGTMFTLYQSIYLNALPKFNKELYYSVGLGYYRLYNPEVSWRLWVDSHPDPTQHYWDEWNTTEELIENAFGFNLGLNYDHRIYKEIRAVFEVRFHQLMFSEELQQFLKFQIGFLF